MLRSIRIACTLLSICGLAVTAQAQMDSAHQTHVIAQLMQQQGNVSLPTAIQTAERQTNGQAINADAFVPSPWQTGGAQQLKYAVTCVTANNQLQTVFIDARTGQVESVQPVMMNRMGMAGSQQMGQQQTGQQYGQPYGQQQPGWQERNWQQQGQPGAWQGGQGWQQQQGYGGRTSRSGGGDQFNQPQYGAPQQRWGGSDFESEPGFEAQANPQGWGGQFGQQMGGMQSQSMMAAHPERASKLIGNTVKNDQNQDIGRIEDLAINTQTGRVPLAVLNANNQLYPIPFRLIRPSADNQVTLNIPQDRLQGLPTLDKANWPQSINDRLVNAIHQNLGLRPEIGFAGFRSEGGAPPGAPTTQPTGPGAQPGQEGQQGAMPIRKATDLMNQPVRNQQGETLGTIKDLVIDPQRARLAYVVVSFSNMGDRFVAVPWDAFTIQQGQIMLNADQSRLEQAQSLGFTQDNWPDMSNPEWAQREAEVFGTQPYPMMGPGRTMGGMMPGAPQQMRGGQPAQPGQGGSQQPGGGRTP